MAASGGSSEADLFAPQRAHRLLWLVPLALLLFAVGAFAWTWLKACGSASATVTARAAGVLALVDALALALMLSTRRFDSPRDAVLPTFVALGVTFLFGAIAIPNCVGALDRGKQKRTMGDMRTISRAMEARAGGRADYPVVRPEDIEPLARALEPTYVRSLPRRDGWNHAIRVASDGRSYTIISYGCCGEPDGPDVHVQPNGGTTTFSAETVFTNGAFVKFPDGTQF